MRTTEPPSSNVIPIPLEGKSLQELCERAARNSHAAEQRATSAYDEARRARREIKDLNVRHAKLGAEVADNQAQLLIGLATIANTAESQEALSKQVKQATFNAQAARADVKQAEERAEEITGRHDLRELARQSRADADAAIVQRVASTFLTQEEQDARTEEDARKLKNEVRARRNRVLWKIADKAAIIIISVATALLAARYGLHIAE